MTGIEALKAQVELSGQSGNWDYSRYHHGLHNGLELALATIEGREPEFKEAPEEWLENTISSIRKSETK